MKIHTAIVVGGVLVLHWTSQSIALSTIPNEGGASLEILGASTNTVVYQYVVSGSAGWVIECADPIREKVLWSLQAEEKATQVSSPLDGNINLIMSSRLLQLDVRAGHTNAVLDFRQLAWPKHERYPLVGNLEKWANASDRTQEEKEDVERERRRLEGYLWSRIYEYQVPLFSTNQILVFREATQNGPIRETYFRDWLLLRSGEPAKVIASGDGGPLALLSGTLLSGHRRRSEIADCPIDGSATNSRFVSVPQDVGPWEIDSTAVNLGYWPLSRGHLACIHPNGKSFCLVYDEHSRRVTKIEPTTDLQSDTDWVPSSSWLVRHTECEAKQHVFEVFSPAGKLVSSCIIPDTSYHSHFRYRGLTPDSKMLFVEHTPPTTYGELGGERLRAFVLSVPDGKLVALHTLNGPANASDISFGLPYDGLVVVAFGERPIIKKMEADEMAHSFWIRAFDIYTGEVKWTHRIRTTIKKI